MENADHQARKKELEEGLRMFTGSERWFRHWSGALVFTEGVHYLAETAAAFWLIDVIASWFTTRLHHEKFIHFTLIVNADGSAVAVADDGNDNELVRQEIPWTDFPLERISLYLTDRTLLLPSEY